MQADMSFLDLRRLAQGRCSFADRLRFFATAHSSDRGRISGRRTSACAAAPRARGGPIAGLTAERGRLSMTVQDTFEESIRSKTVWVRG